LQGNLRLLIIPKPITMCYALRAIVVSSREKIVIVICPCYASGSESDAPGIAAEAHLNTALEHGVLRAPGGLGDAIILNGGTGDTSTSTVTSSAVEGAVNLVGELTAVVGMGRGVSGVVDTLTSATKLLLV